MGYVYKNGRRYKRRRYRLKPVPIFIALVIVVMMIWGFFSLIGKAFKPKDTPSSAPLSDVSVATGASDATTTSEPTGPIAPANASMSNWNLVLLNRENSIDKDYSIEKTKFDNQFIDARVAPAYQKMCDAAKVDGITLFLRSGFRTIDTQKANYEADVSRNMTNGMSRADAKIATEKYYALPGQSEHHTGLALDIITPEYHKSPTVLDERFAQTDAYKWLIANCNAFGFVLRYPESKVTTTKINFEPWHFRYVGSDNAKYMTEKGICLEEYIAELGAPPVSIPASAPSSTPVSSAK